MRFHLVQIVDIADLTARPALIQKVIDHFLTRKHCNRCEGFWNRAAIRVSAADVVYFPRALAGDDFGYKAGDVAGMNVIPHLLALVPVHIVLEHTLKTKRLPREMINATATTSPAATAMGFQLRVEDFLQIGFAKLAARAALIANSSMLVGAIL
jgi:hypothetical protein